ncbi:sigma-70 family RNA polymerase sigma factor [Pseudomonas sp. S2_B07]
MVKLNPLLRMAVIAGVEIAVKLHVARGDDLDARDSGGATPLMLASARRKKGIVRLLLVAGANPELLDSKGRGVIAYADKGGCPECIALLRQALDAFGRVNESVSDDGFSLPSESTPGDATITEAFQTTYKAEDETAVVATQDEVAMPEVCLSTVHQEAMLENTNSELDDLLNFESAIEPQEFFARSNSESASGSFVAIVSSEPVVWDDKEVDWDLDLSTAQIAGDGISTNAVAADHGAENDFLKVRNRGRKSVKRAVLQTGTRLSINPEICITWAKETLMKGWCSFDDVDRLVAHCEGNGDFEELRINLQRNLESAGFDLFDHSDEHDVVRWDARSDISDILADELAEAIEAALTRETRLPGTQKFSMDKSYEQQLLGPIARAKQEFQLGILASEAAIGTIFDVFDSIRNGYRAPDSVSLRIITPSRLNHTETAEVMAAVEALKSWQANGRRMEGKQRREALDALNALDISLAFHKDLVRSLEQNMGSIEHSIQLGKLISVYEAATARLIREHLPFARRFAARNVEEGEDPEDVFQVVYTGLQRSTRRFDSARGDRFVIYCTFWMQQALTRWRADESASVRVPAHRYYNLTMLDRALDKLDIRSDGAVSDNELATELGWTTDQVREFRRIPRNAEYPESIEDWDELLPAQEHEDIFDNAETVRIVVDALAELDSREAAVIKMRFGIGCDEEMTLEEIGKYYDLTRERIRQIETKALQRLSLPARKARLKKLMGIE